MGHKTIIIIGEHEPGFPAHERLRDAVRHASSALDVVVNTRWYTNDELARRPGLVEDGSAIIVAPRGSRPTRVLPAAVIAALKTAREHDTPTLATGDGQELSLIEFGRNVAGIPGAASAFYDEDAKDPIVKEVMLRDGADRIAGTLDLEVRADPVLSPWLPPVRREEQVDLTHVLNPDYVPVLEEAGLHLAGTDAVTGRPFLLTFPANRWHVAAAFLPQLRTSEREPHPLFVGLLSHATGLV